MKHLSISQIVKKSFLIGLFCLGALFIVACSGNDAANDDAEVSDDGESEAVTTDENEAIGSSGEEIRVSNLFPSDIPIPEDAISTLETTEEYEEEENESEIGLHTQLPMEELKDIYGSYFNQEQYADDLVIYIFEEDERYSDEKISYVVETDEYFFAAVLDDYGDERAVGLIIRLYD